MSRRDAGILGAIGGVVVVAAAALLLVVYGPSGSARQPSGSTGVASSTTPASPSMGAGPEPGDKAGTKDCPGAPPETAREMRLMIPKLNVNAHSEPLGLDAQGQLATPTVKYCDVGWYQHGPAPGAPGDAVMDGHLDWYGKPAVFWKLESLRPGDEIVVRRDTAILHFRVVSVASVPYNSHPPGLFDVTGPPRLSLLTCAGDYDFKRATYLSRLIVNANFVSRTA